MLKERGSAATELELISDPQTSPSPWHPPPAVTSHHHSHLLLFSLYRRQKAGLEPILTCFAGVSSGCCWELRDAVVQLLRTLKPFFKFPSSFSPVREEKSRACAVRLLLVQLESESCACAVSCPCTVPLREAQLLKLWSLFFFSLSVLIRKI